MKRNWSKQLRRALITLMELQKDLCGDGSTYQNYHLCSSWLFGLWGIYGIVATTWIVWYSVNWLGGDKTQRFSTTVCEFEGLIWSMIKCCCIRNLLVHCEVHINETILLETFHILSSSSFIFSISSASCMALFILHNRVALFP